MSSTWPVRKFTPESSTTAMLSPLSVNSASTSSSRSSASPGARPTTMRSRGRVETAVPQVRGDGVAVGREGRLVDEDAVRPPAGRTWPASGAG